MLRSSTIRGRDSVFAVAGHPLRALAERHLERFAVTVGDLPASPAHHRAKPAGLDVQSMEAPLSLAGAPELTRSCPLRSSPSKISLGRGDRFCRLDGH
jgi:hypothetical protein